MTKTIKTILLLIIITFSFQLFIPASFAQSEPPESLEFTPQVPIPGSEFGDGKMIVGTSKESTNKAGRIVTTMYSTLLPRYIKAIYNYGIGIAAFLALAMIVAGGLIWLTSGGSTDKISTARSMIVSAIIGLILLLGTYTLLQILSPALLNFKAIETEYIGALQFGCCEYEDSAGSKVAANTTDADCKEKENYKFIPTGYSPNISKTACITNGCCLYPNRQGSAIESCLETNNEYCAMLKDKSGRNIQFSASKCSNFGSCSDMMSGCNGKFKGAQCKGFPNCWCYKEIPYIGKALPGEMCGSEGTCTESPDFECPNNLNHDVVTRGRKCENPIEGKYYFCCK